MLSDIGYASHKEAFLVFAAIGFFLGFLVVIMRLLGYESSYVVNVATEALSLRIFSILSIIALLGLLLASLSKAPGWLRRSASFISKPFLRAGLSAGFIASGMAVGFGLGGCSSIILEGVHGGAKIALSTFLLGLLLLLYVWPISYLAAELLGIATRSMKITAAIYSIGSALLFFSVAPFSLWMKVLVIVALAAFLFLLKCRWRRAQQGAAPDRYSATLHSGR